MSFRLESYFDNLQNLYSEQLRQKWSMAIEILFQTWQNGEHVLIAGNGGNFLNALHFATDWGKGIGSSTGKPLKCSVAGENIGLLSALENDIFHENVIIEYSKFTGIKYSVFLLLSAGGTSRNIIQAAQYARERGIFTIGLLGGLEDVNQDNFDIVVKVRSLDIQLVEDLHSQFGHTVYKRITERT